MAGLKPCETCGAGADEPCDPHCPNAVQDSMFEEDVPVPLLEESKRALMASVYRLPFAAMTGSPPDHRGRDLDMWLAELADWMHTYLSAVDAQIADLQEQSRQRIALQIEKDVITGYLRGAA